ncbi:tRNA (adenosine(37)-N6)-threonylcarbamoyltransferase complex ATPase subunit type 1 TsaE [Roseovarius sp. M141]|uniref:tRNA (adenosine(37)-N6)-threonylcarbamoyltransferase complex ATPase subunit type 1 TsaE n=1 Tax=Roseovarius sp. M141 TaxID=2583806 RepID=UPI0020CE3D6B|nr:tRNA (adenosine(37)-N6)-threonylcarbamoyltransferase complex ATPase subunit type 1 TsaE [Roseovarius sp. M141]MCQ0091476.1 tRNA (adenosine(37)-N6)-threonylcarbamoyltransferase complex ATPase subunit type 1 TsaE [Roseovarius sp. M141]
MHKSHTRTLTSDSPDRTCAIAHRLAPLLMSGDVLLLTGDIGAGKTHFARCLIQSLLPVPEDVPSPTYTLVQTYPGPKSEIWHADLYRLSDTNEVFELGLIDAFDSAICLIEWPDRLGDLAPPGALRLTLAALADPSARLLTLEWRGENWTKRIEDLLDD